jgi:cyclopropane-fatty-acyl-phospholipid synthase
MRLFAVAARSPSMTQLRPFYEQVQAHYDLSNEFFALFLDPSMTYSCAYFEREGMTLAEAQLAKIDLSLSKCDLRPGMRLLDVGCGWSTTIRRAAEKHDVHAVGLTLSRNQYDFGTRLLQTLPVQRGSVEIRLEGWEDFDEPVDRIVSIGAFEHFRRERYHDFFTRCRSILPPGGRMLLHSILLHGLRRLEELGISIEHRHVLFAKFMAKYIFPGGQLCDEATVCQHARKAGFSVERVQSLQPHYARTLDCWAANLQARREEAVAMAGQEVYDRYLHYLTGCADLFRSGHTDVAQFTLLVA